MPQLKISLSGPLLIAGGQAGTLGVDLATARRFDGEGWVPYIPGTALRGAVRLQLEALLAGVDRPDAGPYVLDGAAAAGTKAESYNGPVARLFGFSGRRGRRTGAREGCLRFSDALPVDGERARAALTVRPGLEIDDYMAAAADQKLFFREVADVSAEPLVFLADLDVLAELEEGDEKYLRAAVETAETIGGGKAKGGGLLRIEWLPDRKPSAVEVSGDPASARRAKLIFTLEEPAHFGDGGPQGNHHGTRTYAPGATVCGAIAWSLLRNGVKAEDAGFQGLFGERSARFGDALPVADPRDEPEVRPATRRQRRGGQHEIDDLLIRDLARRRVNARLERMGLYLRLDDGVVRYDPAPARPAHGIARRTRTRVSIDRYTGAAADGKLFSIEQIEPWLAKEHSQSGPARPATLACWVEGLDAAGAELLAAAARRPILLGAGRNHGLGRAGMQVQLAPDAEPAGSAEKVLTLANTVDEEVSRLVRRASLSSSKTEEQPLPLVLVALSDFVPSEPGADHPLAEPELATLAPAPSGPVWRYLSSGATGGYDQMSREGRLKDLLPAVGAGSVFVYEIERDALAGWLGQALPALRLGVGGQTRSGCGRFALYELPAAKPKESTMQAEKTATIKTWLVGEAERILEGVKGSKDFGGKDQGGATSQLRNLLQIAQGESEVAVLRNFVRYQAGRRATKAFWLLIYQQVIEVLEEIAKKPELQEEAARRKAIQQFFGYMVRHYVFLYEMAPRSPRP